MCSSPGERAKEQQVFLLVHVKFVFIMSRAADLKIYKITMGLE
jgi:hypothetical protein